MNIKGLCVLGVLVGWVGIGACGGGSSSGGSGGATATGSGGAKGSGGAGGKPALTVASACSAYCAVHSDTCPTCASLSPVLTACIKFCIAESDCSAGGDVTNSIDYRCMKKVDGTDSLDTLATACKTAYTDWYTCLANQSQVCVNGAANQPGSCTTQADALSAACN